VVVPVVEHPFESVTLTVYVPAPNDVAIDVNWFPGVHKYEYGEVPPDAETFAEPLFCPQVELIEVIVFAIGVGLLNVIEVIVVHPLASDTLNE
jgi:hypothetical protein